MMIMIDFLYFVISMEARLAARKSKVDDLKLKQEEVQRNRKQLKEKEKEKLNAQLVCNIKICT